MFSGREYLKSLPSPLFNNNVENESRFNSYQKEKEMRMQLQRQRKKKDVGKVRRVKLLKDLNEGLGISITVRFAVILYN